MEMKRCERGHYYDASIHMMCPYCNVATPTEMTVAMGVASPMQMSPMMSNGEIDRTVPMGGAINTAVVQDDSEGKTVALFETVEGIEPVVGWLICIEGDEKGKEYRLHSENNYVGRSVKMDVALTFDETISRENQAVITYDSEDRTFYISPGSGRSVIKVNGKPVFQASILNKFDQISLGKTKLLFMPLCGDQFSWDE